MPRRINFFDGAESSTVPTVGNIDTTSLIQYANDAAYESANLGAPLEGNIYANTTLNVIRYYNGTSWINISDQASDVVYDNSSSGLTVTDVQGAIDEVEARLDFAESTISTNSTDISNLETLSGEGGNTNHGTFTGTTIPDNSTTHQALQALETEVELKIDSSEKGAANGVATLDGSGQVPASQLPSFVDDVLEYADFASLPVTGETGKIYVTLDNNNTYRWTGSIYIEVSASDVTSVNSQTGDVVLALDDLDDVTATPVNAYYQLRRDSGNTFWESFDPHNIAVDNTLGANITLVAVTSSIVRLTNASLVSVDMIPAGYSGQRFILINRTTVSVTINDETGATAANRILTGTGDFITLEPDAALILAYDGSSSRWQIVGGTGGQERFPALANDEWLTARNSGNTADVNLLKLNTSNEIEFSDGTQIKVDGTFRPQTSDVYSCGDVNLKWADVASVKFTGPGFNLENTTTPSGMGSVASFYTSPIIDAAIFTGNSNTTDGVATRQVLIETGNKTNAGSTANTGDIKLKTGNAAGSGNSGNIVLDTGTINSGSRGYIALQGPSLSGASAGDVWTLQSAVTGEGAWSAPSSGGNLNVASYSSATTANIADDVILLSGASFTLGLPTASGATGKVFRILHQGTSLTQVYTIDPNGAETIRGQSTFLLHTNGQRVEIVSDGTNWQVLDHYAKAVISGGTVNITSDTGSNPTKGTTVRDSVTIYRDGDIAKMRVQYYQSGTGTAGTANYLLNLPTNIAFDSSIPTSGGTVLADTTDEQSLSLPGASFVIRSNTGPTAAHEWKSVPYSTTQLYFKMDQVGGNTLFTWSAASFDFAEVIGFSIEIEFKVANWEY